jgi:uncharacterized ParB-like nuclease family protein
MRRDDITAESRQWRQARNSAFVQDVLASFSRRPADLLSFEDVQQKLQLGPLRFLDPQEVPLDQIVGSVGRYADFTRAFFPRKDHLQARWQHIEDLLAAGRELPPIELYKVGQVYFVRDGNHRVSVARQRGKSTLKACIWEYETDIPLEPDSDIDDVLRTTAHVAFLERTNIEHLCPEAQIRLTEPGGYEDLFREIQAYQQILSRIDKREIASDEALTLWYEIRYTPIVEVVRQSRVLQYFPGRTETDLYLWLCRNLRELEETYGHYVLGQEAAHDLRKRFGKVPFSAWRIRHAIGWSTRVAAAWLSDRWRAARRALRKRAWRPPGG